jgi:hypothetical protein
MNTDISNKVAIGAAISKHFGCKHLTQHSLQFLGGKEYAFDYHDPQENVYFKVFNSSNLGEYSKYEKYPGERILIFDGQRYDASIEPIGNGPDELLLMDRLLGKRLKMGASALVFYDKRLWVHQGRTEDGVTMWHSIPFYEEEQMQDTAVNDDALRDQDEESGLAVLYRFLWS